MKFKFHVPIHDQLQNTDLGLLRALRKLPFEERKTWRRFVWIDEYRDDDNQRWAIILAEK